MTGWESHSCEYSGGGSGDVVVTMVAIHMRAWGSWNQELASHNINSRKIKLLLHSNMNYTSYVQHMYTENLKLSISFQQKNFISILFFCCNYI
jgi:hypothetical protein